MLLTWEAIAKQIGVDEAGLASACLGFNSMKMGIAEKLCTVLELSSDVQAVLQMFPP